MTSSIRITLIHSNTIRASRFKLCNSVSPFSTSPYAIGSSSSFPLNGRTKRIAIIGGGITGLSTAYYAAKRYPNASITVFETSNRLGGVIDSMMIKLPNGEEVAVCEMGPRTLRANAPRAIVMIDLIRELGMEKDLILVPKADPIASVRYIYYPDHLVKIPIANASKSIAHVPAPDHLGLHRLVALIRTLWTEPLFRGLSTGLLRGIFNGRQPYNDQDESIKELLTRRFGKRVTNNVFSAVFHGLYAGDMSELSARALMPGIWTLDTKFPGPCSLLRWMVSANDGLPGEKWRGFEKKMLEAIRQGPAGEVEHSAFSKTSIFSFKSGVGTLAMRLEEAIRRMENVQVELNTHVSTVSSTSNNAIVHIQQSGDSISPREYTHVISTASLPQTLNLLSPNKPPPNPQIHHVPVMTVTLCYVTPNLHDPYLGFGYLLPSSLPAGKNPENVLGVIFDSTAIPKIDTFTGTKITVMLGGRYWSSRTKLPTQQEGFCMAKAALKRQLGITEEPVASAVRLERQAIPQYGVGHFDMLKEVHGMLGEFEGRVRVAGNCYNGIGVHDCLFSARRVVDGLDEEGWTGLEWVV